jgi:hypothetical protein
MKTDLGAAMVRLRIATTEEKEGALLLEKRKARREELLAEARENPKPRGSFVVTWFRTRRTILTI